ncbi:MAG: hypothetical protein ACEPOW_12230 [Bacteroidales bacterium]
MKRKFSFLVLVSSLLLLFSSCKDRVDEYDLRLNFEGRYLGEQSWVLVQSPDFNETYDFVEITGRTSYELNDVGSYKVNITLANKRTSLSGKASYFLQTFYNIPAREWYIKGDFRSMKAAGSTQVKVTTNLEGSYNLRLSTRFQTKIELANAKDYLFTQFPVSDLDENDKVNFLALGWNETEKTGFFEWLIDQDFKSYTGAEAYPISATKPIVSSNIVSQIPISYVRIDSYSKALYGAVYNHYQKEFDVAQTSFPVFFAGLPQGKTQNYFVTVGSYPSSNLNVHRHYTGNSVPANVNIGNISISANYNAQAREIENIRTSGTLSYFLTNWVASNSSADYYWEFSVPRHFKSFQFPNIPTNLFNAIKASPQDFKPLDIIHVSTESFRNLEDYYRSWFGRTGYYFPYTVIDEAELKFE